MILGGPHDLIQTIYHEGHGVLDAVAIDKSSGKIATCTNADLLIYRPYGRVEGALKVVVAQTCTEADDLTVPSVVSPVHITNPRRRNRSIYTIMGIRGRAVDRELFAETIPDCD